MDTGQRSGSLCTWETQPLHVFPEQGSKEGNTWYPGAPCPEIHAVLGLLGACSGAVAGASCPLQKTGQQTSISRGPGGLPLQPSPASHRLRSHLQDRRGKGWCDWQEAAWCTIIRPSLMAANRIRDQAQRRSQPVDPVPPSSAHSPQAQADHHPWSKPLQPKGSARVMGSAPQLHQKGGCGPTLLLSTL